jgi:hypothetical protein
MIKRFSFLILLFSMVFSFGAVFVPVQAFAAEVSCDCFCKSEAGAVPKGKITSTKCTESCKGEVVACATEFSQYPSSNPLCFTAAQCKTQKGVLNSKQAPECLKNSNYCYPDPALQAKIKLQLSVGGLSQVSNLGDYVDAFYKWMLNAGIIIAIVFVMIGGLQYVMAGGHGSVDAGKTRIKNAVIGLVLLTFSYLILFTVNPSLVRLQVPQLPMVKTVGLFKGAACEDLKKDHKLENLAMAKNFTKVGYKQVRTTTSCGATSKVIEKTGGEAFPEGTVCTWRKCGVKGTACVGNGDKALCVACGEIVEKNGFKIQPSSSTCKEMSLKTEGTGESVSYKTCGWTKDGDLSSGTGGIIKATDQGSCAMISLDCSPSFKCSDYNNVPVSNSKNKNEKLEDVISSTDSTLDKAACFGSCGDFSLGSYCEENKCGVKTGCAMYNNDCMAPKDIEKAIADAAAAQKKAFNATCFVAGTKILMSDGEEKNIEDVQIGDVVRAWDENTKQLVDSPVVEFGDPLHDELINVQFEHTKITSTFDHPYWIVGKGWASYAPEDTIKAHPDLGIIHKMNVGDVALWNNEGELVESKLLSIEEKIGDTQTYIFQVDKVNTFFANGILVHNK